MNCKEILLNACLEKNELTSLISEIFGLEKKFILIEKEIPENKLNDSTKILCITQTLNGEFSESLSLYIRDKKIPEISEKNLAIKICRKKTAKALISDDSPSPYQMNLIDEKGDMSTVHIDATSFEKNEYKIV